MKIEYIDVNNWLTKSFTEMKEIYENNLDDYIDLPYALYESEFVPFIMKQLNRNNIKCLKKIFNFIENLLINGDDKVINLVEVAVVESIYFENDYKKYKHIIFDFSGEKTKKSFDECVL